MRFSLAILVGAVLAAPASAQINQNLPVGLGPSLHRPGSLLIYPVIDVRGGTDTVVCVTNVNTDERFVPGLPIKYGDVTARFFYVILTPSGCVVFDDSVDLTPGDTFAVSVRTHLGLQGDFQGWLYVIAADIEGRGAIDFDSEGRANQGRQETESSGFIGEEMVVQGAPQNYLYALPAISFKATRNDDGGVNSQGFRFTDVNGDGEADFDGREYQKFPQILSQPTFLEQSLQNTALQDELVLLTPIFQTGNRVDLNSFWYNNNEDARSRTFSFTCWTRLKIRNISAYTQNLGGIPTEAATGWFWIDPVQLARFGGYVPNPPVHGAFIHQLNPGQTQFWASVLLHQEGEVDPIPPNLPPNRGNGLPNGDPIGPPP
jgi:hypothetical protein